MELTQQEAVEAWSASCARGRSSQHKALSLPLAPAAGRLISAALFLEALHGQLSHGSREQHRHEYAGAEQAPHTGYSDALAAQQPCSCDACCSSPLETTQLLSHRTTGHSYGGCSLAANQQGSGSTPASSSTDMVGQLAQPQQLPDPVPPAGALWEGVDKARAWVEQNCGECGSCGSCSPRQPGSSAERVSPCMRALRWLARRKRGGVTGS
uniref:Uncharacterized protein n=1 Tax=Chlamydomonas leiostraca TaxID=1034604 RepID=A0A7S0WQ48_9CHLO|mmetsp:Transcript_22346/g.56870  ORF Transcript_22346/g.56870 Transcript_22346/m.56870 type:complete len:211 (+) Transcript_22346:196-828(+)